ncbi:MAG: hypothetical protein GY850_24705 [bacterium]|nr:hypothetical protein [bacterium]
MAKKLFEKYDKNPEHIPGIYNYCDRWCERCPFTSRCLNFEMSEEKFSDLQDGDINNEVFWQRLSETLQETMAMLKEMAEERGVDLDSLDIEDAQDRENHFEEKPVVHMASHMAKSYIDTVEKWFNANVYIFEDDARQMAAVYEANASESQLQADTVTLIDSVEVIRWYQHQIYVKLQRAIHSSQNEDFEIQNGFPKDSDGSTKVALIGMDRSISAWGKMIKHFPDQKKNILNIITHLDRLRRRTEKKFPHARAFVRPGFDDHESEDSSSAEKDE